MAKQTDDTMGFPRLPFDPTPPPDMVSRAMDGAEDDPAGSMRRVVSLIVQHMNLQRRNDEFQARFWGTADVSEENAEHWQYIRNGDFAQGTNGNYKWTQNASVLRILSTSGLPYNADRAVILVDTSGSENWVQQSCSAMGGTWYTGNLWMQFTSGQYAGLRIIENSGSAANTTHANMSNSTAWRQLPVTFKTYKGTTRLTYRMVLATNAGAAFCLPMLEKARRPHPWRPHLLDRGNLVTSLKTAGSASWTGNIVFSHAGLVRVRQVATKKFVWSSTASLSSTTPKPVSATAAVGTATQLARADHVHPGVRSLRTAASASADGRLQVSGSGAVRIRQTSGKFIWSTTGLLTAASTTPAAVSTAGTVGVGTTAARADHVHRGVKAIKSAAASADGTLQVVGSGGVSIAVSGQNLRIHAAASGTTTSLKTFGSASWTGNVTFSAAGAVRVRQVATKKFIWSAPASVSLSSTTPAKVSTAGTVGVGTTAARADHVHRGVTSLFNTGVASADGRIGVVQSGDARVQILGNDLRIYAYPTASSNIEDVSSSNYAGIWAARARGDHVHKGVRSIRTAASASYFGNMVFSGAGAVRVRQSAGLPRKFIWSTTGLLTVTSSTPNPVSATGAVGVATTAARADHVHPGVRSLRTAGSASADGRLQVSGSGAVRVRQTAGKFVWSTTGLLTVTSSTPVAVSTSGTVGVGTTAARSDHRHRGVKAMRVRGAQGSASGTVRLSQSSNVTVRRSGQTVIIGATTSGGSEAAANAKMRHSFFGG